MWDWYVRSDVFRRGLFWIKWPLRSGQVTQALPQYFDRVVGADPSEGMIETAKKKYASAEKLEFVVASGEEVDQHVEEGSVDLVTAGTFEGPTSD